MRPIGHLTPRYVWNRVVVALFERRNPEAPWLTHRSIPIVETLLRPTDAGLEFGAGRSTAWFGRRVAALTSVESDPQWYARVKQKLEAAGLTHVRLLLLERNEADDNAGQQTPYVRIIDTFGPESLDFALIDAYHRSSCALGVIPKLRPGGLLIVDNVNWYLPSETPAPASRRAAHGPANPEWADFLKLTADWRYFWMNNGVTATAFWFKPPATKGG